jgi:squalene-associated FAD-dependent desaturase
MNAVVVGGGYAGIAAALALADAGEHVTLLEARRHWGGRATSWPDPKMDDDVDNGQHVWMGCYDETLALLERLGTRDRIAFPGGLDLAYREPGGRAHRLHAPAALGRPGLALALLGFGALPVGDRIALGRALASAPPPGEHDSAAAWLDALGQPAGARRAFWAPLCEAAVNLPLAEASAALLYAVVVRAFRGAPGAAAVGVPRAGLAKLVAPVADALAARGGRARLGAIVRGLAPVGDGFRVVVEGGEELACERVVLALPAEAARVLLGALPAAAAKLTDAARVPSSPIVTVTLWFDPGVALAPVTGLLAPDEGFHWVFDRGAFVPARRAPRPVVLVASAARELALLPTAEIVRRARAALAHYALTTAEPVATRVVKEPHATPAFTPAAARARPASASGVPGLAFAGDWTATGLPATIEGAVRSGLAAARNVILRHPTSTEAPE